VWAWIKAELYQLVRKVSRQQPLSAEQRWWG
jgi:hypothetical protein